MAALFILVACGDTQGRDTLPVTAQPTSTSIQPTTVPTAVGMAGMGDMSNPSTFNVPDDTTYIDMMIPHHQLAVDMARIAQEKATHGELKGLASDIVKAQKDEIRRMGLWRLDLAGSATPNPSASGMMPMPGMSVDLEKLKVSPNFDHDFIVAMIPHHQSAIDMSQAALPNLKNAALHDMAQDVITTQQIEIDRMNGWLKAWK